MNFFKHQLHGALELKLPKILALGNNYSSQKAREAFLSYWQIAQIYHCQLCGQDYRTENLEIHHLIPRCLKPEWSYYIPNMVLICHECHMKCHNIQNDPEEIMDVRPEAQPIKKCMMCCQAIEEPNYVLNSNIFHQKYYHKQCWAQRWIERVPEQEMN